jgi:hypothetical protein
MKPKKILEEGDACPQPGCPGRLEHEPLVDCRCHLSAPCRACEERGLTCNECGEDYDPDES